MSTIPKDVLETFPKKIYLQTTDEDECEPFIDNHEATWCNQRMHTSDVEYLRADLATDGREQEVEWISVHDNSNGFRDYLDLKGIEYKRNGHFTAVKKEVNLYWLGRQVEEWKLQSSLKEKDLIIHGIEEGSQQWEQEYKDCRKILQDIIEAESHQWNRSSVTNPSQLPLVLQAAKDFLSKYQHQ